MGLDSTFNWFQTSISNKTLGSNSVVFSIGTLAQLACEIGYAVLSKMDRQSPSPFSRIDRLVLDSRQKSKTSEVKNEDKVAIVTGANCGIGLETAKALGRAGFHTILACRSKEKGDEAVDLLKRQTGLEDRFEVMTVDLASLESVNKFVEEYKKKHASLDILVDNAGVMMCPYSTTKDDIEMQFGTNHVGHFALTLGLLDNLKAAKQEARIVVLSSMAAFFTQSIEYERVEKKESYDKMANYAIAKLANLTFANTLARKLKDTNVTVNTVHPGSVATNLTRHVGGNSFQNAAENLLLLDVHAGALTSIYAALSPEVEGQSGLFFTRCLSMDSHPRSLDIAEQDKLWEYTEKLIAEKSK